MNKNLTETIVGAVVLVVAALFLYKAYNTGSIDKVNEKFYKITADFDRIDGIEVGSLVRVSGIKVGRVSGQSLDRVSYAARITMDIYESVSLPKDTSAEIVSSGLIGDKYVSLVPGGEDEMLQDGNNITFTQSSVNIENLIGKMMFNSMSSGAQSKVEEDSKIEQEDVIQEQENKDLLDEPRVGASDSFNSNISETIKQTASIEFIQHK